MGITFTSKKRVDKQCTCIRCGKTYVFTVREQDYFKEKGFVAPKRCKVCRGINRREMQSLGLDKRGKYFGLGMMAPTLYKSHFKGGIDVTDISGTKYQCKRYYGF